jgi:hypothetical protein
LDVKADRNGGGGGYKADRKKVREVPPAGLGKGIVPPAGLGKGMVRSG